MKLARTYAIVDAVVRSGSFRKAADRMAITSTALNRQVLALEKEMGVNIFERMPHGVKPTVAGEILVDHIRKYFADLERVKSTIADLSGVRRGHVSIATSIQIADILPSEIAAYRDEHPGVTFAVNFLNRPDVEASLLDHSADLALVLGEMDPREFMPIFIMNLPLGVMMRKDHDLARRNEISLGDCTEYPVALPDQGMGAREIIESHCRGRGLSFDPVIESNSVGFLIDYVKREDVLSFLVAPTVFGHPMDPEIVVRKLSGHDSPIIKLQLVQLRGKVLSVASAKFASRVSQRLAKHSCHAASQ